MSTWMFANELPVYPFLFGTFRCNKSILAGYIWIVCVPKITINVRLGLKFDPQAYTCFGWPTANAYKSNIRH